MNGFFCKLKRNKLLLATFCIVFVIVIFDFALLIFDAIEFGLVFANSVRLSNAFVFFNIFVFALNVVGLICILSFLIFNKLKLIKINKK